MPRYEKTQKGNPFQLVVNQHTFPARSISRFVGPTGRVQLQMKGQQTVRQAKPTDSIFCAQRTWDQSAETVFAKHIEDKFQQLAELITSGAVLHLDVEQTHTVSMFFALWLAREQLREKPLQDIVAPGLWPDSERSKQEEEGLEKAGLAFSRGNTFPARVINGLGLRKYVQQHLRVVHPTSHWGIVRASDGEFVAPDCSLHPIVPVSPTLMLASPADDQTISRANVQRANDQLRSASRRYFFARELTACP